MFQKKGKEMKKAARVFIIISMVVGCFLIYPIILGYIALKKIDEDAPKDEIFLWGVLIAAFVSQIGGILMILYTIDENKRGIPVTVVNAEENAKDLNVEERLKNIRDLLDRQVIDQEEYDQRRAEILKNL